MSEADQIPYKGLSPDLQAQLQDAARAADIRAALLRIGVGRTQIEQLVTGYSLEEIERQLEWLPYRKARKPSSMIMAAITQRYDRPAALETAADSNSSNSLRPKQTPNSKQ